MTKSLTFIFIVFMMAKFYFKKFCFKIHRMTSPYNIVINVDIGMLLTWNFQKIFKTKFASLKNFSILKEKFWQGKIYPPSWRIWLKSESYHAGKLNKEYVSLINSKASITSLGDKPFLALKISVTSFCRFLWWMFEQLSSIISNSWNDDLKSL